jgi:S-adenosyl-L-methionine hydrolase (adenosine-forming)
VNSLDRGAVFLLSDYGEKDEFAAVTRAVVLATAPGAVVIDLTHEVPPFDVRAGALTLSRTVGSLGPGVVIGVVDPGVGTDRRAVAVAVAGRPTTSGQPTSGPPAASGPRASVGPGPRHLVGPDNGLLGWAIDALGGATAAVALAPAAGRPGATFDGRDLFAPAAARLWAGATLHDVGLPIDPASLVRLAAPHLVVRAPAGEGQAAGEVEAEVLWVDRFGNGQLAARPADGERAGLGGRVEVTAGAQRAVARRIGAFAELAADELGLMEDANGFLALVCDRRPAATVLAVAPGDIVILRPIR